MIKKGDNDGGFKVKRGKEKERVGIFNRINIDKDQFIMYGPSVQDDLVKKRLVNELKPEQIKTTIDKVDQAYASLLTANQLVAPIDYG